VPVLPRSHRIGFGHIPALKQRLGTLPFGLGLESVAEFTHDPCHPEPDGPLSRLVSKFREQAGGAAVCRRRCGWLAARLEFLASPSIATPVPARAQLTEQADGLLVVAGARGCSR
jgi:hypothetical protein